MAKEYSITLKLAGGTNFMVKNYYFAMVIDCLVVKMEKEDSNSVKNSLFILL